MLQEMRKYSKSWIANIFLGLLTLSFVSWGVGDIITGRVDTSVVKVGRTQYSQDEYRRDFQNAMKQEGLRRGGQPISAEEARRMGLGNAVLEQKIANLALDNVVHELGLIATDAQVTAAIQRYPGFAGITGEFDHGIFLQAIQRFGYNEAGFYELIRSDMSRGQISRAVEDSFSLPPGYARLLFAYFFERRAADYIVVDEHALAPIPPPPDATLQAYITVHAGQFSTPEYRDVTFAYITPADVAASIHVTDDQIQQAYEDHRSEYVTPEKRDIQLLLFRTEAAAGAAFDKTAHGTKYEDLTNEAGEKAAPATAMTAADLDAATARAVFALAKNGISAPLRTATGSWAIYRVTAITAGVNRSLDQVKEEIRARIVQEMATAKLSEISNIYTDASSSGLSLMDAARKAGMHTGHVAAMDEAGLAPDGTKAAVPDDPDFRTQVFHTETGEEGDPQTSHANMVFVVAVNGVVPPKLRPLAQVRDRALAAWTAEQRAAQLRQKVAQLTQQANREGSLAGPARAIGATVQKSPGLEHTFSDAVFSQGLVRALFDTGPHQAVSGPRGQGGGYVIAQVTGIVHPQLPERSPQYLIALHQLEAQAGGSVLDSLVAQLRADQKVVYNRRNIDSIQGAEAQ